jgi:hypothetical protein
VVAEMIILLDTNVWRYIADENFTPKLIEISKAQAVKIAIAPILVLETSGTGDHYLRRKILEIQTRKIWYRLMPEGFFLAQELVDSVSRFCPQFLLEKPNVQKRRSLIASWRDSNKSWWSQAQKHPDKLFTKLHSRADYKMLELARIQKADFRSQVASSKTNIVGNKSLIDIKMTMSAGSRERELDFWRWHSKDWWETSLTALGNSPFRQWLSCDVKIGELLNSPSWRKLWWHQAEIKDMPRHWLMSSFYLLQGDQKVTPGTPVDQTLSVHALDVDLIVTADKNFAKMMERCKFDAPFKCASCVQISAGASGLEELCRTILDM